VHDIPAFSIGGDMRRWGLIVCGLLFVALSTLLLTANRIVFWLIPIEILGKYEIFHIIGHVVIFGSVMLVAYPRKIGWVFVIIGGIAIEVIQLDARDGWSDSHRVLASLYDMGVDIAGAAAGWLLAAYRRSPRRLFYVRR
jgi:hypothetical protein